MKDQMIYEINGWTINFEKNVYMYYHKLVASKNGKSYELNCESLTSPKNTIGIGFYGIEIGDLEKSDLITALEEFGRLININVVL